MMIALGSFHKRGEIGSWVLPFHVGMPGKWSFLLASIASDNSKLIWTMPLAMMPKITVEKAAMQLFC